MNSKLAPAVLLLLITGCASFKKQDGRIVAPHGLSSGSSIAVESKSNATLLLFGGKRSTDNGVVIRTLPAIHCGDGPVSFILQWNGYKIVYGGDTAPNNWFMKHCRDDALEPLCLGSCARRSDRIRLRRQSTQGETQDALGRAAET